MTINHRCLIMLCFIDSSLTLNYLYTHALVRTWVLFMIFHILQRHECGAWMEWESTSVYLYIFLWALECCHFQTVRFSDLFWLRISSSPTGALSHISQAWLIHMSWRTWGKQTDCFTQYISLLETLLRSVFSRSAPAQWIIVKTKRVSVLSVLITFLVKRNLSSHPNEWCWWLTRANFTAGLPLSPSVTQCTVTMDQT